MRFLANRALAGGQEFLNAIIKAGSVYLLVFIARHQRIAKGLRLL
jgi:hypothetical protein